LWGCSGSVEKRAAKEFQDTRGEFEHGDYADASRDADAGYREFSARNSKWAWRFRVLEGEVLVSRGLNVDSLALLDAPVPAELAQSEIAVRQELFEGLADCGLQRFSDAEQRFANAERLAETNQKNSLAEVVLGRGTLAFLQGDYPAANAHFLEALKQAQTNHQPYIESKALGSLGLATMYQEHFDEAIDWYTRSLALSRFLNARAITAKTLGNMGWCYHRMGDQEKALSLSLEAKNAATQLGVEKDEMLWMRNIGTFEYSQRAYAAAETDYLEALALARKLQNKAAAADCLNNLAHVELKKEQFELAAKYNAEALSLERANNDRSSQLYSLITDGYIAADKKQFAAAEKDFVEVVREKSSDRYLTRQAEAGLADVYVAQNRPTAAEAHFQKAMATIEATRSSVRREDLRLSFLSGVAGFYGDYIDFLVAQGKAKESLEVAEVNRARTLAEGLGFASPSVRFPLKAFHPEQTAKQLDSTVFSYWLGLDHSYLWVITPERVALFTLPPAAEIDPLVQSYRQALLGSRDVLETQNEAGRRLYDLLVAPAAKFIPKGSRVTILPDGSLYGLSFEALLAPSPQLHYWIEDVDVSYANSLTLLAAGAARRAASAKKLLLVGDPISPDAEFPNLPQAAAEMTQIENYFPATERTVFSGVEATPDSYLQSRPESFSYIHFVAHGTASRTSPLDSALILTKQGDNYKLYARDIIQHPLHADLVTISACHGEGVRTYSGEGLVGLSWAFLHAGAHAVIAALWEVSDTSTPQLMDHLYSEIGKGVPPDVALRDAKLALLHSGSVYRRPFYWAPFEFYRGS
jgi:CHAT domain-containing protein